MRKEGKLDRKIVDTTKAKLIAYGIVAAFIGVMAVLGVRSVSGPQLYDGDKLESRDCPRCEGRGTFESEERCRGCVGAKKLKVIIPGPEHPVSISGTVRDLGAFKNEAEAREVAEVDATTKKVTLKPVRGAVGNAQIVFKAAHGEFVIQGKATGRYSCAMKPGEYEVTVTADGFPEKKEQLTVPVRTHPVWPKMPGYRHPDPDALQYEIFLER